MRARRVPMALVMAVAAATALAGCSGDDEPPAAGSPAPSATAEGGGGSAATPVPAASLTALVPGRTIDDSDGLKITVSVVTLKRQGKLTLLEVAARNDSDERANLANSLRGSGARFDEATLVDPVNGKRYLVARDSKDECLCTSFFGGVSVEPGGTAIVSAYFAAPPDDVTALNVVMPGAGTFTGVPVGS
jgi:hypothetical protein